MDDDIDTRCINTLRFLAVDAVQKADSGHPGLPLGAAPMAWVLWDRFLKHHPQQPTWADRDRFVLSAGHGSALLYGLLMLTGYAVTLDDLQRFRQWGSKTPGHPEYRHTPGVEATTGPLGQGFGNAVGMAIAEAQLAARYNKPGHTIIDHRTFVIASDGDLMEGVASEAASLAGHLKLGKLICLYDDNRITLAAGTDITFTEDRAKRFDSYGWHTQQIEDGNDLAAIDSAIRAAIGEHSRPSLICIRTHIGFGSPEQDSFKSHGSPLGEGDVAATKRTLGWPQQPAFLIPDDALAHARAAGDRGERAENEWNERWKAFAQAFPEAANELQCSLRGDLPDGWDKDIPTFAPDEKGIATREAGGKVLTAIAAKVSAVSGGSADLDPSTNTALKNLGVFQAGDVSDEQGARDEVWNYAGRNIHFGVREHAMGAIANGMAYHGGFIPYTATFFVFSDYMRPAMRLAALSRLHVVHVFTHDSIGLGEDGPTHQPVEQLAALRAMPNMQVIRPADANEAAIAWRVAMEHRDGPTALIFSRQKLPILDRGKYASADGVLCGAYVLHHGRDKDPSLILIASGSEVSLVVKAAAELEGQGIAVRVVSMPCWELFERQSPAYRAHVLPANVTARLAVEAGSRQGWDRYVGALGDVISVDRFGASAPAPTVFEHYGFTIANVVARARNLLKDPIPS